MSAPELFLGDRVALHAGDCLDVLKTLAPDSLDGCVTDPPYHFTSIVKRFGAQGAAPSKVAEGGTGAYARASRGFMGQTWDGGDIAFRPETWAAVLRVLKPGAHLVAFGAPKCMGLLQHAIEAGGFEVRDTILDLFDLDARAAGFLATLDAAQRAELFALMDHATFGGLLAWIFGTGFPKSHDPGDAYEDRLGWFDETERERGLTSHYGAYLNEKGTALKPAFEPIILARKPLAGTVLDTILAHGTGALGIDGCRVGSEGGTRGCDAGPSVGVLGDGLNGSFGKPVPGLGRWPANITHDGSDVVVSAFPAEAGAFAPVRGTEPSRLGLNVYGAMSRGGGAFHGDTGSAARFFYSRKADANERVGSGHPTVKPLDLMRWLVRLVIPAGGTVLDLFAGTGTTGEAAFHEGMRAVLIEREAKYRVDIARRMALAEAGPAIRRAERAKARGKAPKPLALFGEEGA